MGRICAKICAFLASTVVIVSCLSGTAQQSTHASVDSVDARTMRLPDPYGSNGTLQTPPASRKNPRATARQRTPITEAELLSGVNLTNEQKLAIDRIHRDMRAKMQIVAKDENESPEQKGAMLEGMNRMQMRQVFDVLMPEQREEVRKRIQAMRSASRPGEKNSPDQKAR